MQVENDCILNIQDLVTLSNVVNGVIESNQVVITNTIIKKKDLAGVLSLD